MERAKSSLIPVDEVDVPDIASTQLYHSCLDFLENHDPDDEAIDSIFEILSEALKSHWASDT